MEERRIERDSLVPLEGEARVPRTDEAAREGVSGGERMPRTGPKKLTGAFCMGTGKVGGGG